MKFGKLVCVVLALATVLCVAGCSGKKDADAPDGMILASSDEADYLFYVPDKWHVDESTLFTSAYYSTGDPTSISVSAYGLKNNGSTVNDWWAGFQEEFSFVYSDVEISDAEDASLGSQDAVRYSVKASLAGAEYNFVFVAAIYKGYVYYLTYTSTPEFNENHTEELEQVIKNFSFK